MVDSESPARKKVIQAITEAFQSSGIKPLSQDRVVLPQSQLDRLDKKIVDLACLFIDPLKGTNEPSSLSFDESGAQKKLNPQQLESVKNEGKFDVPSRDFAGQSHVWKVHNLLQKGEKNIQASFVVDTDGALSHIADILLAFFGGDETWFSFIRGLRNIILGLRNTVSAVVGLVEELPKYGEGQIRSLLDTERNNFVVRELTGKKVQDFPAVRFDPRLYDEALAQQLSKTIDRVMQEHNRVWSQGVVALRRTLRKNLKAQHPDKRFSELEDLITIQMQDTEAEELKNRLMADEKLEELAPGYGLLLSNRRVTERLLAESELRLDSQVNEHEASIRTDLIRDHKILAKNKKWLQSKVSKRLEIFRQETRLRNMKDVSFKLDQLGLGQEAAIIKKWIEFESDEAIRLRAQLASERMAAGRFEFPTLIWRPSAWLPERHESRDGVVEYHPIKYRIVRVETSQWLWRLRLVVAGVRQRVKGFLHFALVDSLWNGPLGLRALCLGAPFFAGYVMNRRTGAVEVDTTAVVPTYRHNLARLWEEAVQARAAFERAPDRGFLGKRSTRWLHQLFHYGIKGVVGTAVVGLGQPALTALNVVASLVLSATCPAWSLLLCAVRLAVSAVVWDLHAPRGFTWLLPIPSLILQRVAVRGAAQVVVAAVIGGVWHPAACVVRLLAAVVRRGLRTAWDAVARALLLRHGVLPAADGWAATRVRGPGLAWLHYHQVAPEVALLALQAQLELAELEVFEERERARASRPLNDYLVFFDQVARPFGPIDVSGSETTATWAKAQQARLRELEEAIGKRRARLRALAEPPHGVAPRMAAADLARMLAAATAATTKFYAERLVPLLTAAPVPSLSSAAGGSVGGGGEDDGAALERFWGGWAVDEGDFSELGRRVSARAFGEGFLEPLEAADRGYVTQVREESLREVFDHLPGLRLSP